MDRHPRAERGPYQGVTQIVRFNWPFYAIAAGSLAVASYVARRRETPAFLKFASLAANGVAAYFSLASLVVSWWVYDHSSLYNFEWVNELLPAPPSEWANLHCGLDESSPALMELFPNSHGQFWDFYDAGTMTEPSIRSARQLQPPPVAPQSVDYRQLPAEANALDAIFLFFAAHEIRGGAQREAFFRELGRILRPGGRILMLEHARDGANFLAFGPGILHFFPEPEWRRLAEHSGLQVAQSGCFTPFVRLIVLTKPGAVPHDS